MKIVRSFISVFRVFKYDNADRPYGQIGKNFLTREEAETVKKMCLCEDKRKGEEVAIFILLVNVKWKYVRT